MLCTKITKSEWKMLEKEKMEIKKWTGNDSRQIWVKKERSLRRENLKKNKKKKKEERNDDIGKR